MTYGQPPHSTRFGRRTFIAGTAAAGLFAACSGGEDVGSGEAQNGGDSATDSSELDNDTYGVVQRMQTNGKVLVPGPVRLPFSLTKDAEMVIDGPDILGAQLTDIDGQPIGDRISATRRDVAPNPYYAYDVQIDEPGIYGLVVDGGPATGANFQVFEPSEVVIPLAGQQLRAFDTPTVAEPTGVDPVCTREPACDFHSMTLTEALATGRPVAYFVGTPAFCQTGTCVPALEAVIELQPEFDDIVFVHAEVYTDLTATDLTPAVNALTLSFEPTLFVTDADGVIVDRIDIIWNAAELRERLTAVAA